MISETFFQNSSEPPLALPEILDISLMRSLRRRLSIEGSSFKSRASRLSLDAGLPSIYFIEIDKAAFTESEHEPFHSVDVHFGNVVADGVEQRIQDLGSL
jgi:hypothetical protein